MDKQAKTLNQALLTAMDTYADQTCFYVKRGRRHQPITYRRFLKLAFRLVNFFHEQGISDGQRIVIIADNPLEWMVVYIACLLSGGVVVPLRAWMPADTLQAMVAESGAYVAIVQGVEQCRIIEAAGNGLNDLRTIIVVDDEAKEHYPEVVPITSILAKAITTKRVQTVRNFASQIEPDAVATIYYKTSQPLGVVFTQANRLAAMQSMAGWFSLTEEDVANTTVLSWSLSTLDTALYYFLSGVPNVVNEEVDPEAARQTNPTVMLSSPSGFETFYNRIMSEVSKWPASRQTGFQWALTIGKEHRAAGLSASKALRDAYRRADSTFFSQFRAEFGGKLSRMYSTGAPLPPPVAEFAEVMGVVPLNVYSLTEAGGFPAVSMPDARRPGSCGQVAPGFQIHIADDAEIWVRGKTVMDRYWRQPDVTRQVLDSNGWLHTGDLGRFDQDGFLYITGHKRPLIMLSTGRTIRPDMIENPLTASPFVAQAAIFGESRPHVTALIVPDLTEIEAHLGKSGEHTDGLEATISHPKVKELIDKAVEDVNRRLDKWSQIEQYTLLEQPFTEASGELTTSLKVNHQTVAERYAAQLEAMYPRSVRLEEQPDSQIELDPEELRELLEKQDLLDAWLNDAGIGFLFDLAREKQIDVPSMANICDIAASIAQMQHEEKPLSTALIVGDPARIARILPESEIQLHRYDHIRRMRYILVTMAKMVDGMVLGYVIGKHGYVRGVHKLEVELDEPSNFLLGPRFRHNAAISKQCDAVVFFVPSGGRQVRVFADGQLVGRYSNGNWSSEYIPDIDKAISLLDEEKNYNPSLLRRVLGCAFQMSERNLGAIFIIGDADDILERSDPPEISAFATIVRANLDRLSDQEIINFAKQDGATVIDVQGKFRGCMVLLRPDANTKAEIGPGKGARHSSAAKMSAEAQCLAITVSQDGPITIYDSGERVLSI